MIGAIYKQSLTKHLRRGHIRRLKDETIWVNACAELVVVLDGKVRGKITQIH